MNACSFPFPVKRIKMPSTRPVRVTFFCLAGLTILCSGCRPTNYENVAIRSKLRELDKKVERLEGELKTLRESGVPMSPGDSDSTSAKSRPPKVEKKAEPTIDRAKQEAAIAALKSIGGRVIQDDQGRVVDADLLDSNGDLEKLASLKDFPSLKRLTLSGQFANEETFELVGQLASLESLSMEKAPATPAALQHLVKLKKLRFLQLFRSSITDD